jgi:hypothetical protein
MLATPRREKREDSATLSPQELQSGIADATGAALGSLRAALGSMEPSNGGGQQGDNNAAAADEPHDRHSDDNGDDEPPSASAVETL